MTSALTLVGALGIDTSSPATGSRLALIDVHAVSLPAQLKTLWTVTPEGALSVLAGALVTQSLALVLIPTSPVSILVTLVALAVIAAVGVKALAVSTLAIILIALIHILAGLVLKPEPREAVTGVTRLGVGAMTVFTAGLLIATLVHVNTNGGHRVILIAIVAEAFPRDVDLSAPV